MAYIVMVYIFMAYIVMAYIVIAYIVMAHIVQGLAPDFNGTDHGDGVEHPQTNADSLDANLLEQPLPKTQRQKDPIDVRNTDPTNPIRKQSTTHEAHRKTQDKHTWQ